MKEEISLKIIDWLANMGNVMAEEIPPFISEVATYGFWIGLVDCITMFIVGCFLFRWAKFFYKKCISASVGGCYDIGMVLCGVGAILTLIGSICSLENMIKAKVAPKLYVIERFIKK